MVAMHPGCAQSLRGDHFTRRRKFMLTPLLSLQVVLERCFLLVQAIDFSFKPIEFVFRRGYFRPQ